MQALAITERGAAPAVLDIPDREPAPKELRVRVEAVSINGFDIAVAGGRVWDQMPAAFPVVLGREFAGVVESIGAEVEGFAVGDRVAGRNPHGLGAGPLAEHFTVAARNATHVPDGVTSDQAAAVGLAGVTALD